mgnify:CR=1 FL=1
MSQETIKVVLLKTDGRKLTLHLEEKVARDLMQQLWILLRQVPEEAEPK